MKCYTAWTFKGKDPNDLHCTHKFLGDLTEEVQAEVLAEIDAFFGSLFAYAFFPRAVFQVRDFFGPDKNVAVLTPKEPSAWRFWPGLRERLGRFRGDDYGEYIPHVTTKEDVVDEPFETYAFIRDGVVIKEWKSIP